MTKENNPALGLDLGIRTIEDRVVDEIVELVWKKIK